MNRIEKYIINIKNYNLIKRIDEGSYGCVYFVQDKKTKQRFAAKIIHQITSDENIVNKEIKIMIRLQHPTIIKFYGYSPTDFEGNNCITLFLELAEKGSLQDLLDKLRRGIQDEYNDDTCFQKILIGISRGMKYLHSNHAIHRDLKPANILLDSNLEPHIADFGSAKIMSSNNSKSQTQSVGTYLYMAPEAISSTHYNEKVDVYSFGIIMYEIVTQTCPYDYLDLDNKMTSFEFCQKVVSEKLRPEFKVPIKDSFRQLIVKCWSDKPENRPSFEEIYNMLTSCNRDTDDNEPEFFLDNADEDEILDYIEKINMNSSGNDVIDRLNREHQEEIDQIKKLHLDEINNLRKENQDQIDQIKRDHLDEISHLRKENRDQIDQIKRDHLDEINNLRKENQDQIDQIKKLHLDEINNLRKEYQDQISKIKNEYQDKIFRLERSHQDEENKMKAEIKKQANTIKTLKNQMINIQKKNEIEIERLNSIIDEKSKSFEKVQLPILLISIPYRIGDEFNGIINYFKQKSNVYNEVKITSSSIFKNDNSFSPFNVINYDDLDVEFHTNDLADSWICFEFINHKIIPKNYTIRSFALGVNASHMRNWVVECMSKTKKWEILDAQTDCNSLNGRNYMFTFTINNKRNHEYSIIRIRQTGPNWRGKNYLKINSIEFYGFIQL